MQFGGSGRESLIPALRAMLGEESVLTEKDEPSPFGCDGLSANCKLLMAILLPSTIEEVQGVLRLFSYHGPSSPRGGNRAFRRHTAPERRGFS